MNGDILVALVVNINNDSVSFVRIESRARILSIYGQYILGAA